MGKKILIMGLPGSGKTTLASEIVPAINAKWLNADQIRKKYNDWDFSKEGRKRQSKRMSRLADNYIKKGYNVIADFICPTDELRNEFNADYLIWVDTIKKGRFDDTNKIFVPPKKFDFRVTSKNSKFWSPKIVMRIKFGLQANLLDCTLRDGGYYNNWNFKYKNIQEYLSSISKTGIKFVELGFRFIEENKIKGLTAYTDNQLIEKLKIPKDINIGVMINTGDLLKNNLSALENCKRIFNKKNKKLKFVRLACHYEEIFLIKDAVSWLKKNKFIVFVNLMQISEINMSKIKTACSYINKTKTDIFYFADSLGSLTPLDTKKITKIIKKYSLKQIGIHAHDNLGNALKNSIEANKNGAKWIDCTITGMGRGPGNLKTEDIIKYKNKANKENNHIPKKIKVYFNNLKKIYKWGKNRYYFLAAKHKIHPTYIQKILSDKRYKKNEYLQIINQLKKIDTKKFNPYKLINSSFFLSEKATGRNLSKLNFDNENYLILGPGNNLNLYKNKVHDFIKRVNPYVICINTVNLFKENLVDLRVACHPMRILSDFKFHKSTKTIFAMPYSMMSKNIKRLVKVKKSQILDYGLLIKYSNEIKIKKKYCILPSPLAIGYCLSMLISSGVKGKQIFLAGFDGYDEASSDIDETGQIISLLKKDFLKIKLKSLTPTKYLSLRLI